MVRISWGHIDYGDYVWLRYQPNQLDDLERLVCLPYQWADLLLLIGTAKKCLLVEDQASVSATSMLKHSHLRKQPNHRSSKRSPAVSARLLAPWPSGPPGAISRRCANKAWLCRLRWNRPCLDILFHLLSSSCEWSHYFNEWNFDYTDGESQPFYKILNHISTFSQLSIYIMTVGLP